MKIIRACVLTLYFLSLYGMDRSPKTPTLKKMGTADEIEQSYKTFWQFLQKVPGDVIDYLIDMVTCNQQIISEGDAAALISFFEKKHIGLDSSLYGNAKDDDGVQVIKHVDGKRQLNLIEKKYDASHPPIFHYPQEAKLTEGRAYGLDVRFNDKTFMVQDDNGLLFCKWIKEVKDEPTTVVLKRYKSPHFASAKMNTLLRSRRGACFAVDHEYLRILQTPRNWHSDWSATGTCDLIAERPVAALRLFPNCMLTEWSGKPYRLYMYLKDEKDTYRMRVDMDWPFQLKQFKSSPPALKRYIVLQLAFMNNQIPLAQQNLIKRKLFTLDQEVKMKALLSPFILNFFELRAPRGLPTP